MTIAHRQSAVPGLGGGRFPLIVKLALRELRGGFQGFYIFVACVALGVAAIGAVGTAAQALKSSLAREGQLILGGDIAVRLIHRRANAQERSFLDSQGTVSEVMTMRAMVRTSDGKKNSLVDLKAVDDRYPLFGTLRLRSGDTLSERLSRGPGVLVEPMVLERLDLSVGDPLKLGEIELPILGVIEKEPDRLTGPASLGPRVLATIDTLQPTGLLAPGSLARWRYRIRFPDQFANDTNKLAEFREEIKTKYSDSGFSVRDRTNPSPNVNRAINRLSQFLTLVGLTALLVGGVGVANAVSNFVERKKKTMATFKCLGASTRDVYGVYLVQISILAGVGILIGLFIAAVVPPVLAALFKDVLPFDSAIQIQPSALALAGFYGLLVALLFVVWPLGRAREVKPQVLMRDDVSEQSKRPHLFDIGITVLLALILAVVAISTSDSRQIAFYFCVGLPALFVCFLVYSSLLKKLFAKIPKPRQPELKLALANLSGPGSLTRSVVLSLGAGLSLLITVSLVDRSMTSELETSLPENAPDYFILNISKSEWSRFSALFQEQLPGVQVESAPMLRGRITQLNGRPADEIKATPDVSWVLRGDRGLSYEAEPPKGSRITQGEWWPPDHKGDYLVSFADEIGRGLGLKIGDTVTVNVLGRNIQARIANFRTVEWESLSINFVMVFSPNTLQAAPARRLATLKLPPDADFSREADAIQEMSQQFPNVTSIRVQDAINAVISVFEKIMIAIRSAGSLTLIAGVLVLAGALVTAQQKRIYEALILKSLGAVRRRIVAAHFAEYLILALATSLLAIVFGVIAAWVILTRIMELNFVFSFAAVIQAVLLAIVLVLFFGAAGTWRVLGATTSSKLRNRG